MTSATAALYCDAVAGFTSVATLCRGDVDLVSRGVGERPPRWRELVADHAATRSETRGDPRFRLLVRHPDRDVDRAPTVAARLAHLLEPERYVPIAWIDEIFARTIAA